jgi:tetratricopeptide (TPR) repeat protein
VQLHDCSLVRAAILDTLGVVYQGLGEYHRADLLLMEALSLRLKDPNTTPEELASSWHNVGCLRLDQGKFAEAEKWLRQALALRKQHVGNDAIQVARTEFHLVWTLAAMRSPPTAEVQAEADRLFNDILRIQQLQLGEHHRDVGVTLAAWATWKWSRDAPLLEVYAMIDKASTIIQKSDPHDDLASGFSDYVKGAIARKSKNLPEAEKLYRQALAVSRKRFGSEHPVTALLLGDLAGLLNERGKKTEAEEAIREALTIGRQSPLRWHPLMIEGLQKLANAMRGRNDKEAEALYREALQIARALQRKDLAQPVLDQLNSLLREQNRHAEVKDLDW